MTHQRRHIVRDHASVGDGEDCTRCGSPSADHRMGEWKRGTHPPFPTLRAGHAVCAYVDDLDRSVCGKRLRLTIGRSRSPYWIHAESFDGLSLRGDRKEGHR